MATPIEVLLRLRDEVSPGLRNVARESGEVTKEADAMKKVLQGLGFGGLVNDSEDLSEGLKGLGVTAGGAAGALAGLGTAAVGAMAIAGLATVIVQVDRAMLDWAMSAGELRAQLQSLEHLPGFGAQIDPSVTRSVEDLQLQAGALNAIWTDVKVTVGEELAPALATAGRGLVMLALMARDAYEAFLSLRSIVIEVSRASGLFAGAGLAEAALGAAWGGYGAQADALMGAGVPWEFQGPEQPSGASGGGRTPRAPRAPRGAPTVDLGAEYAAQAQEDARRSAMFGDGFGASHDVVISLDDLDEAVSELNTTVAQSNKLAEQAAKQAASLGAASSGLDAAGRIMGGNLGGVAALAGPVGAVVGQAIDTLSMLGREGAAGVADNIRESVYAILQGLKELPKLLTEEIPALISELIPAMTEALIEAMPALVVAQYEAVYRAGVALFRTLFMELPGMLVEAIVEGVKRAWDAIKGFFKDPLGVADGIDWKKTATNILRVGAGVATLGASEIAISAYRGADNAMGGSLPGYSRGSRAARSTAPASSARTSASMGGGGVTINVQNMVGGRDGTRELMRQIRIAQGSRGLGET